MNGRLGIAIVLASATACASGGAGDKKLDPTPVGKESVQVVPATDAAKDFQAQADAVRGASDRDWGDVARRMKGVTQRHPRYGLAWYNLGVAYEKLGRTDEAADAYRRAITQDDDLREAHENLASMTVRSGARAEAVKVLRRLVAKDPAASDARVALASYNLAQGDVEQARALCQDALTYDPEHLGAYCVLTDIAVRNKDYPRARLVAAQGLKLSDKAPCLHFSLGQVADAEGETALALSEYERALAEEPNLAQARFRVAEIAMGYKNLDKAIASFGAVTELEPDNVAAWVNLGVAYKGSAKFSEAEQAYQKATALEGPEVAAAHFNLGVLYLRHLNRLDDARASLKQYLKRADGGGDKAFALLEEIEQLERLAEEEKRMEAEMARQAEIDAKVAAEEAAKKAEEERRAAAEAARAAEEPPDPAAEPEVKAEPEKKKRKKRRRRRKKTRKSKDDELVIPESDDFE